MRQKFHVDPWKVSENELDSKTFRLGESIMSLGNGHMGMRGNFEELYSGDTHQGSYIAGVWYPDKTRVGWWKNGYPQYFGKAINSINYIGIRVFVDGHELDLNTATVSNYQRELDMKQGILRRSFDAVVSSKKIRVNVERFLSVANSQMAAINYTVVPEEACDIQFTPYLDGNVMNTDANYDESFWNHVEAASENNEAYVTMITKENPFNVERFTVTAAMKAVANVELVDHSARDSEGYAETVITVHAAAKQTISLIKYIAVTTSRDHHDDTISPARQLLEEMAASGYDAMKHDHVEAWAKRWAMADVQIDGDNSAQQGIRFNLFQLFSTYYGEDERLNIGPKGFTGEKYGGATYWDTEAYAMPLYLAVSDQSVARNLCLYRYRQLDEAYHNARQQGLPGALYPMVTFNGIECHNEWEITFEEIHRNGAIAYAIYNYVNYTGDSDYLAEYGAKVLIGISKFWAGRVHVSSGNGQYMIHGVTGPNEYENNINNNWYTNRLAAWTLQYTLRVLEELPKDKRQEICDDTDVRDEDLKTWKNIINNMYYPSDKTKGIFVQHDTFLDKDLKPVSEIPAEQRPLNQHWSWDKILRSPYIKQADVLQGIYLFGNEFTDQEKKKNYEFYEPFTVHESSLSPSIHSIIAAEIGLEDKAYEFYQRTARLDLDNYNNDTEDGLHITSMTGSWLSIVQGFAGMRTWGGQLSFAPFLPKKWHGYRFTINYRRRKLSVDVSSRDLKIKMSGEPLIILCYGKEYELSDDKEMVIKRELK